MKNQVEFMSEVKNEIYHEDTVVKPTSMNIKKMQTLDTDNDRELMIQIKNVNFFYGKTQALKNINMTLPEKKIHTIFKGHVTRKSFKNFVLNK